MRSSSARSARSSPSTSEHSAHRLILGACARFCSADRFGAPNAGVGRFLATAVSRPYREGARPGPDALCQWTLSKLHRLRPKACLLRERRARLEPTLMRKRRPKATPSEWSPRLARGEDACCFSPHESGGANGKSVDGTEGFGEAFFGAGTCLAIATWASHAQDALVGGVTCVALPLRLWDSHAPRSVRADDGAARDRFSRRNLRVCTVRRYWTSGSEGENFQMRDGKKPIHLYWASSKR